MYDSLLTVSWLQKVDVTKLKYYYMEDDGGSMLISPVHPEIKEAVQKVGDYI